MDGRRRLGAVLLVAGLALIGVGAYGLATAGSAPTSAVAGSPSLPPPTQVTEPSGTPTPVPPTPTPAATPTATPTPTPSPDPVDVARAFYAELVAGIRATDADRLIALLHPATLDRYGLAACQVNLGTLDDPAFDIVVGAVDAPADWDYVTDERTTTIPSAWTVHATFTSQGETSERELHVAMVGDELRWFTDCGTPLS
jgi:hypothetical protein